MIRIGTRASALALWQARHVQTLLHEAWPELETELVPMTTTGDQILDRPLAAIGGKGLFVKELEHALLEKRVDIAVHSLKDMPTSQPEGLVLDVVVPRASAADVLCGRTQAWTIASLPQGARVGTGSRRRAAQLQALRPDLEIVGLRGNVQTRLDRRASEGLAAVVLAEAGLRRLEIWEPTFQVLEPAQFIPAPGQGAVVVERRSNDPWVARMLAPLHCAATDLAVTAERACLAAIGGDCHTPFAAWSHHDGEALHLVARLFHRDAAEEGASETRALSTMAQAHKAIPEALNRILLGDARAMGEAVGKELLNQLGIDGGAQ